MGIFEKIVLRSRYKLYISENSIITSMHIKRIVKDIYVYAILLKMKKKGTITGLRILLLSGWFASCSRDINYMLFMSLAVVNIKDYADKNVEM